MPILPLIVGSAVLPVGVFVASTLAMPENLPWAGALAVGLAIVLATSRAGVSSSIVWWLISVTGGIVMLVFVVAFEQTLATYLCGGWLLMISVLSRTGRSSELPPLTMSALAAIVFTGAALVFQPVPVSRIELALPEVAVPTHFALFTDPDTPPVLKSTYYQDMHQLSPLTVAMETKTPVPSGSEMPWLRFAVMRDSNVIIEQIRYQSLIGYYPIDIKVVSNERLHSLDLDPKSHGVRLNKVDRGIVVDQIARGEEAWIRLPAWETSEIEPLGRLKVIAARLGLWLLVCFSILFFRPAGAAFR